MDSKILARLICGWIFENCLSFRFLLCFRIACTFFLNFSFTITIFLFFFRWGAWISSFVTVTLVMLTTSITFVSASLSGMQVGIPCISIVSLCKYCEFMLQFFSRILTCLARAVVATFDIARSASNLPILFIS